MANRKLEKLETTFRALSERPDTGAGCAQMVRRPLLFLLLVAGCSKGPDADLQYIGQARSLGAEWALVNEQASRGNLTATYTRTMRKNVREQLQTAAKALTIPRSRYGREMQDLLTEPDEASPEKLRVHVDKLKEIEDSIESA